MCPSGAGALDSPSADGLVEARGVLSEAEEGLQELLIQEEEGKEEGETEGQEEEVQSGSPRIPSGAGGLGMDLSQFPFMEITQHTSLCSLMRDADGLVEAWEILCEADPQGLEEEELLSTHVVPPTDPSWSAARVFQSDQFARQWADHAVASRSTWPCCL